MNEVKTIKLSGNDYAPVDERIRALHAAHPNCSIRTETRMQGDKLIEARATIIIDVQNPERYFTGSAVGYFGKEKALEKLETVAVGRALAFAGFLADGRIASREEIERYNVNTEEPEPPTLSPYIMDDINNLGALIYGADWSTKSPALCKWASGGMTSSLMALTEIEAEKIRSGLNKKLDETQGGK